MTSVRFRFLIVIAALVVAGLPAVALAQLSPPTVDACSEEDGVYTASWSGGGPRYSADFIVTFEDESMVTYSGEMDSPTATSATFDATGLVGVESVEVKVKSMSPGRGQGPQNHPFSAPFGCSGGE